MDSNQVQPRVASHLRLDNKNVPIPGPKQGFKRVYDADRDLMLVTPAQGEKMNVMEWTPEEMWFRSMVIRPSTGEVMSAGFPKFFNHAEGLANSDRLNTALADDEDVYFTEKYDGSLIIRSVIDGKVHLRTRGQTGSGEHGVAAEKIIKQHYPVLNDPEFQSGQSLLFEFVSPEFRIVIDYQREDLVLIGGVDHSELELWNVPELEKVAEENQLRLVELVELPHQPQQLMTAVAEWKDHEGVVARCDSGRILVKIKAADYLARHRLKYALSARAIREVCLMRDVRQLSDFEEYLKSEGGDWELAADSKPLVQTFLDARDRAEEISLRLQAEVPEAAARYPDRRDFAQQYAVPLKGAQSTAAFLLLDGKVEKAAEAVLKRELDEAFATAEAADKLLEDE